jgi:hypothetical protein
MTLEEFANVHELPERWLSLRRECEALVCHPQYWYRPDMQNAARILAVEASHILHAQRKGSPTRKVSCHEEPKTMIA